MALNVYLDASVLVALFTPDPFSARADTLIRSVGAPLLVSDFAAAELASAVARRVRMREFKGRHARAVFTSFDAWTARIGPRVSTQSSDVAGAEGLLRRLDLPLRTPDALHIAIAQRLGASLATFDVRLEKSAATIGLPVAGL